MHSTECHFDQIQSSLSDPTQRDFKIPSTVWAVLQNSEASKCVVFSKAKNTLSLRIQLRNEHNTCGPFPIDMDHRKRKCKVDFGTRDCAAFPTRHIERISVAMDLSGTERHLSRYLER